MPLKAVVIAAVLAAGVAFYLVGLSTGAVTLVGWETRNAEQQGFSRSTWWTMEVSGFPVWLAAGRAIRADYAVDAAFGAVAVSVSPPLLLRTSLQTATVFVEGRRSGSVLFVAQVPGWYTFRADPSPLGGPRCRPPDTPMVDFLIGSRECPTYRVRYRIGWHLADGRAPPGTARIAIPHPHETLVTQRIGN